MEVKHKANAHQSPEADREAGESLFGSELETLGIEYSHKLKEANETKGNRKVSQESLHELIEGQGYHCALTGIKLLPSTASLDHICPLSKGGGHSIDNCQIVHKEINRMKGSLTNQEFLHLCRLVAMHQDSQEWRPSGLMVAATGVNLGSLETD